MFLIIEYNPSKRRIHQINTCCDNMGTYWYGQMNIKGKSKDLNKFEEKYPQIHQFFTEFDIWPWIDEYERTESEINVKISGKTHPYQGQFEKMMEKYKNSNLTMSVLVESELDYIELSQNKIHSRDKFTPNLVSDSSKILDFLDKKYNLIPIFGNVIILEDDGHTEWKQLVEYKNVFNAEKLKFKSNRQYMPYDTALSNMTLNYSGNRTIDKVKTIDFANSLIEDYYPCNLVFKIISKSESEELIKTLKDRFEIVKIIKPQILNKRSHTRYVVCLKGSGNSYECVSKLIWI